jgi:hypothetical protein
MASGGKISILIMRDDAGVRRMRLSPFWIQSGLWAVAFLILAAALFAAGAMYYRGIVAESERAAQDARRLATDAADRLKRLDEIETILRSKDATELQTLLGSYNPDAAAWWKSAVETPPAPAAPEKADTVATKIDLRKLLDKVDLNQAGVDNFKSKVENGKLAVSFDLSNLSPQTALSGKAELLILTNDGVLHPLKADKDELTFQIQRFKQVAVHLALPQGVNPADMYGLRITIADPAGKTVYNAVYPVERP